MSGLTTQKAIVALFLWFTWAASIAWTLLSLYFLAGDHNSRSESREFDLFAAGVLFLPMLFAILLRVFVISRIGNIWVKWALFVVGMFSCYMIVMSGIFLASDFLLLGKILYACAMFIYCPILIRLEEQRA